MGANKIVKKISEGVAAVSNVGDELMAGVKDNAPVVYDDFQKLGEQPVVPQKYELKFDPSSSFSPEVLAQEKSMETMKLIENVVFKRYLQQASQNYVPLFPLSPRAQVQENEPEAKPNYAIKRMPYQAAVRGMLLKRVVIDPEQLQAEKLENIFSSMSELGDTLALVFHRTYQECILSFLIRVEEKANRSWHADQNIDTLKSVFEGNFPGSITQLFTDKEQPRIFNTIPQIVTNPISGSAKGGKLAAFAAGVCSDYSPADLMEEILSPQNCQAISIVTGIPAKKEKENKFISQGIEKLLDGVVPQNEDETYTLFLLAQPLSVAQVGDIKNGLEQYASELSPYQTLQFNRSINSSKSLAKSMNETLSKQLGEATALSVGVGASAGAQAGANASASAGVNANTGKAQTQGTQHTEGKSSSTTAGAGTSVTHGASAGVNLGAANASTHTDVSANSHIDHTRGKNSSDSSNQSTGTSQQVGAQANAGAGASASASVGVSANVGMNKTVSSGRSYCHGQSVSDTLTEGQSEGFTSTYTSYPVKNMLKRIEDQLNRIEACESLGTWQFAAYAIASDVTLSRRVAHVYQGLGQGESTYMEAHAINEWQRSMEKDDISKTTDFNAIITCLLNLEHPRFLLANNKRFDLPESIYCTSNLSGAEMPLALNLPQKAIAGLPVVKCAAFGRNIYSLDGEPHASDSFRLGSIFHMMHQDKQTAVSIDKQTLPSHTFITGSTGAGKSNAIYTLLDAATKTAANESPVHFMVIEPTKGEYKRIFGNRSDVTVYGTNPTQAQTLLRINPFAFPSSVHVLEHIDRLVEIFNACWPMYAAMPAILKDAIETAYTQKGWSLVSSDASKLVYPTFQDLLAVLPEVIKKSNYSENTSSDYVGALVTRVRSLTNGIYGAIFNTDDTQTADELFNQNVIVDLSRVGSVETKALLMGVLVMKLQEQRMHENPNCNKQALQHITVLEEAHTILRRTSSVQTSEGSNIQGKSVEMLSNAIAEMRTYGEGFIIADQSPNLLDPAVIRNTNTKIILRLPDEEDRMLVGKAAALTEDQITELAKLPTGVAAIYQANWLEAVLCKVDLHQDETVAEHAANTMPKANRTSTWSYRLFSAVLHPERISVSEKDKLTILKKLAERKLPDEMISIAKKAMEKEEISEREKQEFVANYLLRYDIMSRLAETVGSDVKNLNEFTRMLDLQFNIQNVALSAELRDIATSAVLHADNQYIDANDQRLFIERYQQKGGAFL